MKKLVLIALTLLASGCTVLGPDFVEPKAKIQENWLEAGDPQVKTEPTDFRDWWQAFDDPVLDALIQSAYQQNLTLQTAGLRILESRAQLGIAIGQQFPQTQATSGAATANQLSKNAANSMAADKFFYDYQLGLGAAWELDVWGRFRRGVESADANLIASVANYDDVLVSLTAEVARTYTSIRTFQDRIRLARQNVEIQARGLQIAEVRFRNGATTELDVTQARSLLRTTEASIPQFEIGLQQSQHALNILLGMPPSNLQDILDGVKPIPSPPLEIAVGVPTELLRRRPDIRRAELQAAAQSAQIGIAQADLYPQFSLTGSFGLQTSSHAGLSSNRADFGDLFSANSRTYFVGPSFSWPIFNYGRLKNNVRVQDARFQQLVTDYQNTVLRAAQEVEDGLVGFLQSQNQVKFLADAVAAGKRSVDLSLIQYRDGAVDFQRVLDSQRELVTNQDQLAIAQGNIAQSLIATYRALGGGWEQRLGEDFVPEATQKTMRERTDWGKLLPPPEELPEKLDPPPTGKAQPLFNKPDW